MLDVKPIFDKLKEFIIPLLAGIIIFPIKGIFDFKGIIHQPAAFNEKGKIRVKFSYRSSDPINNVVIGLNISDTALLTHKLTAGIFVDRIPSDPSFKGSTISYFTTERIGTMRRVLIPELDPGEYFLLVPVIHKQIEYRTALGRLVTTEFRQEIDKKDDLKPVRTRAYKIYYYIFFHPWQSSIVLFLVALLVQILIKRKKMES